MTEELVSAVDQAGREASRLMGEQLRREGTALFEADGDTLTPRALEVFGGYFHPLLEDVERGFPTWTAQAPTILVETARRRRKFAQRVLARYPLTQPPERCQRCGVEAWDALELDHMVELWDGGLDHPYNLVRLCSTCHRAKPLFDELGPDGEKRLAVLTWVAAGKVRWW